MLLVRPATAARIAPQPVQQGIRVVSTGGRLIMAILAVLPLAATSGCSGSGGRYSPIDAQTLDSGIQGSGH